MHTNLVAPVLTMILAILAPGLAHGAEGAPPPNLDGLYRVEGTRDTGRLDFEIFHGVFRSTAGLFHRPLFDAAIRDKPIRYLGDDEWEVITLRGGCAGEPDAISATLRLRLEDGVLRYISRESLCGGSRAIDSTAVPIENTPVPEATYYDYNGGRRNQTRHFAFHLNEDGVLVATITNLGSGSVSTMEFVENEGSGPARIARHYESVEKDAVCPETAEYVLDKFYSDQPYPDLHVNKFASWGDDPCTSQRYWGHEWLVHRGP